MKNGVEYSGVLDAVKISKKSIKGIEDEKVYKQVGVVKISLEYPVGSLSSLVDPITAEETSYDKCVWGPRVGSYSLTVNGVLAKVRINQIQKTNKDEESKVTFVFETEELDFVSAIGLYVKDKDTQSIFKLDYLISETI